MSDDRSKMIDARGHRCPVPSLRLRRALEGAPAGAVILLVADDPMARIDVPHLCAQLGARVVSIDSSGAPSGETSDAVLTFTVAAP